MTLLIIDLWQFCVCSTRSGVTQCTLIMVLYTWAVCNSAGFTRCSCRTSVYLFDSSLQNLAVLTAALAEPLSVSLWNDLADPVFDGVGLAGSKSRANAFFLVFAARSSFVFYCYSIFLLSFYGLVGIVGKGSSDCSGVNRSLPALHCRPLLIIKTTIIILIIKWPQ